MVIHTTLFGGCVIDTMMEGMFTMHVILGSLWFLLCISSMTV